MIGVDVNMLASALVAALIDYLRKHPELVGKALEWARRNVFPDLAASIAKAVVAELPNAVDKLTDVVPGQWDDAALDHLASTLAPALAKKLLPNLGGIFGGRP